MEEDLSIIAKKHVLQGFQNSEDILSRVSALEGHLNDVFCSRQPSTRDYDNRIDLIRILNEISKEIYGKDNECPVVEGFGSFFMDMFSAKSDLDLSINFSDKNVEARRDVKIKALRKFANKFYSLQKKKHVTNVQAILSARVPVLKVTDCGTGIECDLSVGNKDAIAKSHIILIISSIDERFKKLCFLLKAWAKAHDINSSKDGTLNSLSLVLLAAFHLQSQEPPILPPFSAIFKDGIDPEVVKKNIPTFLNYGKENKESLASLFVSLLIMLESVETLWGMGLCASTYEGSWIYKTWNTRKGDRNGFISIEDFTDRSENTARAVRIITVTKIFTCIRHSIQHIRSFTSGKIDAETLMSRLFGTDALTENNGVNGIAHPTSTQQPNVQDSTHGKRKRSKEKREKKQSKKKNKSLNSRIQNHAPPHLNPPLQTNLPVQSSVGLGNEGIHAEISRHSKKKPDNSSVGGVQAQPPLHSNPPAESSVGLRNEGIHAEVLRFSKKPGSSSMGEVQAQAPPHLNPPLHTNSLAQSSVGLRIQGSCAEVLRFPKKPGSRSNGAAQVHTPPHLNPPLQTKSLVQSSVGLRNEGIYAEMWRKPESSSISGVQGYAPPHLGPPLHSTPPLQSSMGFKNERSHAEIWRYPQNHTPPHLNPSLHSNPPLQSSVGYRDHAENRIHPTPNHQYHHEGHRSLASRSDILGPKKLKTIFRSMSESLGQGTTDRHEGRGPLNASARRALSKNATSRSEVEETTVVATSVPRRNKNAEPKQVVVRSTTGGKTISKRFSQKSESDSEDEKGDESEVEGEENDEGEENEEGEENLGDYVEDEKDEEEANKRRKGKNISSDFGSQQSKRQRCKKQSSAHIVLDPTCVGGPTNPSVIPSFAGHILYAICQDPGKGRGVLNHYSQTKKMRKVLSQWKVEGELESILQNSGLFHLTKCMFEEYDMPLISAFVDRWQPDTNTFHMPFGEMTILLHDVEQILQLSVDGREIWDTPSLQAPETFLAETLQLSHTIDIKNTPYTFKDTGKVIGAILDKGDVLVGALTDLKYKKKVVASNKAAAYLLGIVGMSLFTGKRRDRIPGEYLCLFHNTTTKPSGFAWGTGTLAFLYRQMGMATRARCKGITGCLTLLQAWIYLYFPGFRPSTRVAKVAPGSPCAMFYRGKGTFMPNSLERYHALRKRIDCMTSQSVQWCPYGDRVTTSLEASLFCGVIRCMGVTESYQPQRCIRQFGYVQTIPWAVYGPIVTHRPPNPNSYKVEHDRSCSDFWMTRSDFQLRLDHLSVPLHPDNPDVVSGYFDWYFQVSHPLFYFEGMETGEEPPPFDIDSYMQMSSAIVQNMFRVTSQIPNYE